MEKAKIEICDILGDFSNNKHERSSRGQNCWQVQWFFRRFFLQKWGLQFDQTSETQLANRHAKYIVRKEAWDVGYHVHFCRAFRWKAFENEGWIRSPRQLKSFNRTMKSLGSIAFCAFQKASFLYSKSLLNEMNGFSSWGRRRGYLPPFHRVMSFKTSKNTCFKMTGKHPTNSTNCFMDGKNFFILFENHLKKSHYVRFACAASYILRK